MAPASFGHTRGRSEPWRVSQTTEDLAAKRRRGRKNGKGIWIETHSAVRGIFCAFCAFLRLHCLGMIAVGPFDRLRALGLSNGQKAPSFAGPSAFAKPTADQTDGTAGNTPEGWPQKGAEGAKTEKAFGSKPTRQSGVFFAPLAPFCGHPSDLVSPSAGGNFQAAAAEGLEIAQAVLDDGLHDAEIEFPVIVHRQVPESDHALHPLRHVRVEHPGRGQQ